MIQAITEFLQEHDKSMKRIEEEYKAALKNKKPSIYTKRSSFMLDCGNEELSYYHLGLSCSVRDRNGVRIKK